MKPSDRWKPVTLLTVGIPLCVLIAVLSGCSSPIPAYIQDGVTIRDADEKDSPCVTAQEGKRLFGCSDRNDAWVSRMASETNIRHEIGHVKGMEHTEPYRCGSYTCKRVIKSGGAYGFGDILVLDQFGNESIDRRDPLKFKPIPREVLVQLWKEMK